MYCTHPLGPKTLPDLETTAVMAITWGILVKIVLCSTEWGI